MPGLEFGGSSQQPLYLLSSTPCPVGLCGVAGESLLRGPWGLGEEGEKKGRGRPAGRPLRPGTPESPSQAEGPDFSFIREVQGSWPQRAHQTPSSSLTHSSLLT